ncbi:hypothetical protein ACFWOX_05575 [Streptomyces sp. NPDC058467]|uniref:hypothetical protein n=1 Tax=Streptomyces sp. NPDC058467 TaxID=3346513 RepID=UPI003649093F
MQNRLPQLHQCVLLVMSVNPVLAAMVGWVVLGRHPGRLDWTAITTVVCTNALSIRTSRG